MSKPFYQFMKNTVAEEDKVGFWTWRREQRIKR